jgi:hypothetical protein
MDGTHSEAENEDDEQYGDGVEDDVDFEPFRAAAHVSPSEKGDWHGEEHGNASK